jgi:hypothetical protein
MIVPGLTRTSQAHVLDVLARTTRLSEQAVTAAFMDADRGRAALLDPLKAIRQAAYRATAQGAKHAGALLLPTGQRVVAEFATTHSLSTEVAGILVGAAIGLRLGLEARLSRVKVKTRRPTLATKVARHVTKAAYEADLQAAREFGRDMDRIARGSVRRRKSR